MGIELTRRRHLFDGVDFLHRIHTQIDFRGMHLSMPKPQRYLAQIAGRLEHHHRTGMPTMSLGT